MQKMRQFFTSAKSLGRKTNMVSDNNFVGRGALVLIGDAGSRGATALA